MNIFCAILYSLIFLIPIIFAMLFWVVGLGYKNRRRVALGFSIFASYSLVVPSLLIIILDYGQYIHMAPIVILSGGFSVLIFSTDTPGKTLFLHLAQGNMIAVVLALLNMVQQLLGLSNLALVPLTMIVCAIVYIAALRFWAKPLRFVADNLHDRTGALLMPMLTFFIVIALRVYPVHTFEFHPIFCTVMMFAVELGFFLYIYNLYRNLLKTNAVVKQELQLQLLQSELDSYESFVQTASQNRHDLRHHNAILFEYLTGGEVELAREYLKQQEMDWTESKLTTYCENTTANAVLRLYKRKTQNLGITYAVQADIPTDLPLSKTETGTLISNLLENACESCIKSEFSDASLFFSAKKNEFSMKIEVKNSMAGKIFFDVHDMPISQKPGGGAGTRSMIAVVKNHGGMMRFSQIGDFFMTQIIIPFH